MTLRQYEVYRRGFYDGINGAPLRSEGAHYQRGWDYGRRTRKAGKR